MKEPKFLVVVCWQGNPAYYRYSTSLSALIGYAKHYLSKKKYGTINFTLREAKITDEIARW